MSGELAAERWSPAQRAETVLLSIISLLDDAEISSPANVDAAKLLRDSPEEYKRRVKEDVEASKQDIPKGFVVPANDTSAPKTPVTKDDDADFWADSDAEFDFGGSDTEEDYEEGDAETGEVDEDEDEEMDSEDD
jgi:ubiquitin-conjugating enzyme E2 R